MAFKAKNQTNPLVVEVTGYTPYVLKRQEREAAGKKDKSADSLKSFFLKQKLRRDIVTYVDKHEKNLFRSQWECNADKKCLHSRVKWEVEKVKEQKQIQLKERQERLKDLLTNETDKLKAELKSNYVNPMRTKEEMLARYKEIMTQKEIERSKIAEEKVEQQFRNNCDELRTLLSKKLCQTVTEEGKSLMEEKNRLQQEKSEEDKMFAEAWLRDADAKFRKECEEASRRKERDMKFGEKLKQQLQESAQKRIPDFAEDEALLMAEQKRLSDLEQEWERAEKKLKQERLRKELDKCLKDKLKRKAKEVQEDLMLDLYFLDKVVSKDKEKQMELEKKQALKKEQDEYLAYLADQIKREAEFTKKIEKMEQEESDKMWAKREKEWEAEKKKREMFNKKMMRQLYEQLYNKLEKCRIAQEMKLEYDEEIKKQAELDKKYLLEEKQLEAENKVRNRVDLMQQIRQKQALDKSLKEKEKEENERLAALQEAYDKKIQQIISDPKLPDLHPFRVNHNIC